MCIPLSLVLDQFGLHSLIIGLWWSCEASILIGDCIVLAVYYMYCWFVLICEMRSSGGGFGYLLHFCCGSNMLELLELGLSEPFCINYYVIQVLGRCRFYRVLFLTLWGNTILKWMASLWSLIIRAPKVENCTLPFCHSICTYKLCYLP